MSSNSDSSDREVEKSHKPKHRVDISKFQDNEAEVESGSSSDENEYSIDYDDDEGINEFVNDEEEEANDSTRFSIYHQNKRSGKSKGASEKEEISRIAKNFQNQDYYDRDTYQIIDDDAVNTPIAQWRLSLVPTQSTKKLFLVHVKPSKELYVIYFLLRKYFHRSQIFYPTVYSAFYTSKGSGIIYVEAITPREVAMIRSNVPNALSQQIKVVPTSEMTSCLSVPIKRDQISPGQFVRIRRDIKYSNESFQNDLAQVISVDTNSSQVLVKLVPRIDYAGLENFRDAKNRDDDDDDDESISVRQTELTKARNKAEKAYRPPQDDFNYDKLKRICRIDPLDSEGFKDLFKSIPRSAQEEIKSVPIYNWDNCNFLSTFAYKYYPIDLVIIKNLNIGPDEPKKFIDGLDLTLFERKIPHFEDHMYESLGVTANSSFGVNDIALISEGEYSGLTVKILSINENKATVKPLDESYDIEFKIETYKLSKYFKAGDHVKVLSGQYHDQTGEVLDITDKTATVVLDINEKVIEVYVGYLTLTHEINQGQKSIGNYNLFDFVRLPDDSRGVIWRIENGAIFILLTTGVSKIVTLEGIASRQKDRSSAHDAGKRPIIVGQTVVVDTPEHRRVTAQVKHIANDVVFLYNDSSSSKYNGLFVVEPRDCQASTSQSVSSYSQPSRYTSGRSPTDKKLLGKTIMITSGKFKNQLATIKEADKASVRVIMHNTSRLMTLDRRDENTGPSNQGGYDNRNSGGTRWKIVSTKDASNDAFASLFTQKRRTNSDSSHSRDQGRGSSMSGSYGNNYGQQPPLPTYGNDYYRQQSPYNTGSMSSYGSEYATPYQAQSPSSSYQQQSPYSGTSPYSTSGTPYHQYDPNKY